MRRITDAIDDRIIAELSMNARIAHADLATKVSLSRNAVRERIARLERDGPIGGYTIIRTPISGSRPVSAMLFVYRQDRMRGASVINALKSMPEVISCDIVSGQFDLIIRIEAGDADRVREIWEEVAAIDGVVDTVTAFVLSSPVSR